MKITIPAYYGLAGTQSKHHFVRDDTPGFEKETRCPACGTCSSEYNRNISRVACFPSAGLARWPQFVRVDPSAEAFSASALAQLGAQGFSGVERYVPIELRNPNSVRLPTEEYFLLFASGVIRIDEATAYKGTVRCSACGAIREGRRGQMIPIAASANDLDFCSVVESALFGGRPSPMRLVVSWRVVRFLAKAKWKNLSLNLIDDPNWRRIHEQDLTWPLKISYADYRPHPLNSVEIDL